MSRNGAIISIGNAARQWGWIRGLAAKFSLYVAIGLCAFVADYCVFLIVLGGTQNPYIGNLFGICTGIVVSFSLNRKYTFRKTDMVAARSAKFVLVAICGMALSSLIIAILISYYVDARIAKIIAMIVVFGFQFLANALWTFY
jgi:putative flippase GtrA